MNSSNRTAKANAEPKQTLPKTASVYSVSKETQMLFPLRKRRKSSCRRKRTRKAKKVRKSAQQTIPYVEMCRDGICKVNSRLYTKTIRFNDINYQLAQNEDKTAIFENWCDFLNYFDSSIFVQFSFINQRTNIHEFKKQINIPEQDDEFNDIRTEYSEYVAGTSSPRATMACSSTSTSPSGLRQTRCVPRNPSSNELRADILNNFKTLGVKN